MINDSNIFPTRLKTARTRKNLSIVELAELSGVSKSAISKYENGEAVPSVENAINLAKVLDVTLTYLVGGEINGNDKKNYINEICKKYGFEIPLDNLINNLSNEDLAHFESDIALMLKVIIEKYKK